MPRTPEPLSDAGLEQLLTRRDDGSFVYSDAVSTLSSGRILATLDQQTRRIAAVRALHANEDGTCAECWDGYVDGVMTHPCDTIKALDAVDA